MTSQHRPAAVRLDKSGRKLIIPWRDGYASEYGWDSLREACPCVQCQGERNKPGAETDPNVFTLTPVIGYEVETVDLVGNYALQITWSDGHKTGIYTWDYLRGLCL